MMKKLFYILPLLGVLLMTLGCEEELIDLRGDIKGVVKDADGNFLEDCILSITPTGTAKMTGPDGSFEFTRLDPGEYTITVRKEGYTNTTQKVTVISGKVVTVDIVLKHAYGDLKGTVSDENGFIESCQVSLSPGGQTIMTGANGTFEFSKLTPGDYTVTFKKEGYTDKSETVTVVAGKTTDISAVLQYAYGDIKGTVKDENGFVENCIVSLAPGGKSVATGANGTFEFSKLTPGEYTITFRKEGYTDKSQVVTVIAGKTINVDVIIGNSYGDIKGTVKDEKGLLENCQVSLSPGSQTVMTGANGTFEFSKLAPGSYTVTFKKEGYTDKSETVTVVAGKTTDISTVLQYAYGSIKGLVRDQDDNSFIANCLVSLSPGGSSVTTGSDGSFEFKDLSAGDYTLNFKKTGYPDMSEKVTVIRGKATNVNVMMKLVDPITFSESELDFGDYEITKTLTIFNNSDGDYTFTFSNIPAWLTLSLNTGGVNKQSRTTIVATANREKIDYGMYVQNLIVSYSGRVSGEAMIKASIEKVLLTAPEVTIYSEAENVTETSFDIKGNIVATGGSQILDYGHCWSTKENPTTQDNCTRLGQRNELGVYVSTATGLTTSTTYYVRAYARNAQGITYSEQIVVTTQDPYSDKWDGNMASDYAGGSGMSYDPYIIKTGGQLLYALKKGSGYIKLDNNIDLNNHNWMPYKFGGTLDGGGYVISNLYVDRDQSYCGLVGELSGTIRNVTLNGVCIKEAYEAGAIAGRIEEGHVSDCKVVMGENSKIDASIAGGIVGRINRRHDYSDCYIKNCVVESVSEDDDFQIIGAFGVGGIVGDVKSGVASTGVYPSSTYIEDCHVQNCNIAGNEYVGGIVGSLSYGNGYTPKTNVENCEFKGNLLGNNYVGGICGHHISSITSSKVTSNIVCEDDYVGGLCGGKGRWAPSSVITACYADGSITCNNPSASNIYAIAYATPNFCYTTMLCDHSSYRTNSGEASYCYSIYSSAIEDIIKKFKESYDAKADYWNFDNTWTWTGVVNGEQKSVVLPRLAWE